MCLNFNLKICLLSLCLKSITLRGPDSFAKALQRVKAVMEKQGWGEIKIKFAV